MKRNELLWEARKQILLSYGHKAILLGVAFLGFLALNRLIDQKQTFDDQRKQEWQVNGDITEIVREAVNRPSEGAAPLTKRSACGDPDKAKTYNTREELISAMQDRAAACVWEEFRKTVAGVRKRMETIAAQPAISPDELKTFNSYADFIEKERVYAVTRAAAARQYVGAMLLNENVPAKEPSKNVPPKEKAASLLKAEILDEEKGGYVIYQILWYASLLLGVGAASMLFIVILTALPITNGEGYWTKRIEGILERLPTSSRSIAAPLLMAAIGGGTLAGAALETEAGGQARHPYDTPPSIEFPSCINTPVCIDAPTGDPTPAGAPPLGDPPTGTDGWTFGPYYAGDVYNFPISKPQSDLEEITDRLDKIHKTTEEVVTQSKATREELVEQAEATRQATSSKIGEVTSAVLSAERRVASLQETVNSTQADAKKILEGLNHKVNNMDDTLTEHTRLSLSTADDVKGRETDQAALSTQTLAQSAETDPRGALARTFLWTLYKVGPAVHRTMDSRLKSMKPPQEVASAAEEKALEPVVLTAEENAFLEALQGMRDEPPLPRWRFEDQLRKKLMAKLTEDQINSLFEKHFRSLLQICALPRR